MLTTGDKFPDFALQGVVSTDPKTAFKDFNQSTDKGKWKIVFFWPKDFTFVCPTEIAGFGALNGEFKDRDAVIYGVSIDSEFVHLAWRQNHADLKALPFLDPDNIIRFAYVTDMNVGRNPQEVLRVLDALQTYELCPCNWQKGEEVLKAA
jgi:peroxiredoxin (alkyl hydroperoxide reductase subunit C)